jgi:hypothetical protein
MLRDGQRVTGVLQAYYSERLVDERVERFCNLGTWCVLPEYRIHSTRLLGALLGQHGYHFTGLSANRTVSSILARLKFRPLDTSAVLVPNLPRPSLPRRTKISTDPAVIASALNAAELEIYKDHAEALAARHLLLMRGERSCYVIYRGTLVKAIPAAEILYVSDPELFKHALIPFTRHLLLRHGFLLTMGELRIIGQRPYFSVRWKADPKLYRSTTLDKSDFDDLYSDLVCVPIMPKRGLRRKA